jgi:serine/threonine protein kinase
MTLHDFIQTLKHPNIVEVKGVIRDPEIGLVMEFVQHGCLQSYLKIHKDTLQEETLLKFALDVAKVCHRTAQYLQNDPGQ